MSNLTKRALEASLKKLLLKKPLDKITISDIADDCGMNRMTFYYHFQDIYDLIDWSFAEEAEKILEVDYRKYGGNIFMNVFSGEDWFVPIGTREHISEEERKAFPALPEEVEEGEIKGDGYTEDIFYRGT